MEKFELPTCKVCLVEYDLDDHKPASIQPCNHSFGYSCIAALCSRRKTCPSCRGQIERYVVNFELYENIENLLNFIKESEKQAEDEKKEERKKKK